MSSISQPPALKGECRQNRACCQPKPADGPGAEHHSAVEDEEAEKTLHGQVHDRRPRLVKRQTTTPPAHIRRPYQRENVVRVQTSPPVDADQLRGPPRGGGLAERVAPLVIELEGARHMKQEDDKARCPGETSPRQPLPIPGSAQAQGHC